MIVYKDDKWSVNLHMEVIHAYFEFKEIPSGVSYKFNLERKPIDRCPYENEIIEWLSNTREQILEAIWQWNPGEDELIDVKLEC